MAADKHNLIVVAHPDDESIFFAGLVLHRRQRPWHVVCVTDGNADGMGRERSLQFQKACKRLKVKTYEHWDFPDIYEQRIDLTDLKQRLARLKPPATVYTHGIVGEYGHPHHQDVSYAVHETFLPQIPVWSVAYNCYPDVRIQLTESLYKVKTSILSDIYGSETRRFSHLLPATFTEGFIRVGRAEIEAIYSFLTGKSGLDPRKLKSYRWWSKYLLERGGQLPSRPF